MQMSLWGYEKIESLQFPLSFVLSRYLELINSEQEKVSGSLTLQVTVICEVLASIKTLIKRQGSELTT